MCTFMSIQTVIRFENSMIHVNVHSLIDQMYYQVNACEKKLLSHIKQPTYTKHQILQL